MNNKNLPLIIGVALPIVFIVIIAIVIFAPSYFMKPAYNFIYTFDSNYYPYNKSYYKVENGKIIPETFTDKEKVDSSKNVPTLYRYDISKDASYVISYEEAKKLNLDPGPTSPDGYTVAYEYNHDGIFEIFGSNNNSRGYFIEKGNGKKRLSGFTNNNYYYGNFKFIGWIK